MAGSVLEKPPLFHIHHPLVNHLYKCLPVFKHHRLCQQEQITLVTAAGRILVIQEKIFTHLSLMLIITKSESTCSICSSPTVHSEYRRENGKEIVNLYFMNN